MTEIDPRSIGDAAAETISLGQLLRDLTFFSELDDTARAEIEAEIEWFGLAGGAILFRQGDAGDSFYIVAHGCLSVVAHDADGSERLVGDIYRGDSVGEMALISGEPRSATVVACRDTELLRLDKRGYERLIEQNPKMALRLSKVLARRLSRLTHQPKLTCTSQGTSLPLM